MKCAAYHKTQSIYINYNTQINVFVHSQCILSVSVSSVSVCMSDKYLICINKTRIFYVVVDTGVAVVVVVFFVVHVSAGKLPLALHNDR